MAEKENPQDQACAEIPQTYEERFPILRFFTSEHLPSHLRDVARPLENVAHRAAEGLVPSAEVSAGLRKLLEAKDCFVRAAL